MTTNSDKIRFIEVIGSGSFSVVYKIIYNQKECAIKCSKMNSENDSFFCERVYTTTDKDIQREVKIHKLLNKHGIGPLLIDHFEEDGIYYLIMELWEGTLKKYSPDDILELKSQLKKMHDLGYAHLDIGLSNILVKNNKVTLSDFGMACHIKNIKNYFWYNKIRTGYNTNDPFEIDNIDIDCYLEHK